MEETSEELPNFSIGIDHLGPDPTSNATKIKPRKTRKLHVSQIRWKTIFSVNFELFIHNYRLNESTVLAQTKV